MANSDILGTQDMLCRELDEIERRRARRSSAPAPVHDDFEMPQQRAQRLDLNALCLSGGGIRSAAFCLGVLQALAGKGMLRQFDYLSTVSGGGFIGGWLQVLIREQGGVGSAEDAIKRPRPAVVRRLRAYTNYLTPQTGPLSTDTWAAIVLYLRNLLINWAVFAPLFLLITLIPIFYRTAIWVCSDFAWINLALLSAPGWRWSAVWSGRACCCPAIGNRDRSTTPRRPTHPPATSAGASSIPLSAGRFWFPGCWTSPRDRSPSI